MGARVTFEFDGKALERMGLANHVLRPALREAIAQGYNLIREYTPVKTGQAQGGWEIRSNGKMIVNQVPYVKYLEEGTVKMQAVGMVRRAAPEIERIFLEQVENRVRKL